VVTAVLTREEAGEKVIPFGKYQGLTVNLVSGLPGGTDFLVSLLKNRSVSSHLKAAIQVFLEPVFDLMDT
jgi:hypothetical protein